MDSKTIMVKSEDLEQIKRDLEIIKEAISPESELTDWAKKELDEARKTPDEEYIDMEDIEKEFLKNAL